MGEIFDFKGISYNKEKLSTLDDVMSPPYDIISPQMQNELYEKNPYNFVRLILGKQYPGDTEYNNRYTRAEQYLKQWLNESIVIESDRPAIYPYKIEYSINGKKNTINGLFTLLKLDPDYKQVLAHEKTLSKPKADRLNLIRVCQANLEPIQLLYMDRKDSINKMIHNSMGKPIMVVKDYVGFSHKLWKIEDQRLITSLKNSFKNKIFFIADGHHRYQTSINYAKEMNEKTGIYDQNAPFNYRMVILTNMFDKGLTILPTHRLITMPNINEDHLIEKLNKYFICERKKVNTKSETTRNIAMRIKKDIATTNEHKFAFYFKGKYYILTLKEKKIMDSLTSDHSKNWRTLDVSILHKIILEHAMKITEEIIEDHVKYTRVDEEAVQFVNDGQFNFSILMNATKIEELRRVAEGKEHMPQKSTYFLPKMLSGLVFYKMHI